MFSGGVQIKGYKCRIVVTGLQGFDDSRYLDEANETVDTVCVVNLNELIVKLFKDLGSIVVIRILDFLGEAVKVYIRKDISVDGLVILVIVPCAFFFEKFSLSQGSVLVLAVCQAEASAVIEPAEDSSDVIDTLNRAFGSGETLIKSPLRGRKSENREIFDIFQDFCIFKGSILPMKGDICPIWA